MVVCRVILQTQHQQQLELTPAAGVVADTAVETDVALVVSTVLIRAVEMRKNFSYCLEKSRASDGNWR